MGCPKSCDYTYHYLFELVEIWTVFFIRHKRMSAWMAITRVNHVAHSNLYSLQKSELQDGRAKTKLCHL